MGFEPSKVKIRSAYTCDHCEKHFSQNDYNNNRNGASGWMWWFCGDCLHLLQKYKRSEK